LRLTLPEHTTCSYLQSEREKGYDHWRTLLTGAGGGHSNSTTDPFDVAGDDARTRLTTGLSGPGTGRVRASRPRSPEIARARMDGTDFFLSSTSVVYVAPTSSVVNPRDSVSAAGGCHGIGALIAAKELLLITTQKWLKPVLHTSRGFSWNRSFSREYFFSRNHSTLLASTRSYSF
jgi:hypothetical protein